MARAADPWPGPLRRRRRACRSSGSGSRLCSARSCWSARSPTGSGGSRRGCWGSRCRRRTGPGRPAGRSSRLWSMVGDPMTWRDLAWTLWAITLGWVVSLLVVILMLAVATLFFWWFGAPQLMALRSRVDLFFLTRGTREPRGAGASPDPQPRRGRRPLGRRAAPARARPARRHPGPAGRGVDEPGHGRGAVRRRPREARRTVSEAREAPARRSATSARSSAASTRPCWPTAAWTVRSGRWPSTWRCRWR